MMDRERIYIPGRIDFSSDRTYICTVVREDFRTGERAKHTRKYYSFTPLTVGGLYVHLGKGYPGCRRVWDKKERLDPPGERIQ